MRVQYHMNNHRQGKFLFLNKKRVTFIGIFGIMFIIFAGLISPTTASSQANMTPRTASSSTSLVKIGVINNFTPSKLTASLGVDPNFTVTQISIDQFLQNVTASTLNVDVVVLGNIVYNASVISGIQTYLNSENGRIFLILGEDNDSQVSLLSAFNLLATPEAETVPLPAIWNATNASNPIVKDINWNSLPEARTYLNASWQANMINVLISSSGNGDPLLLEANAYPSRLLIMTPFMSSTANQDYELSLYYNYINYRIVKYLAGQTADSYIDWPYSPIPHTYQQEGIIIWLIVIAAVGIGGFFLSRRFSSRPLGTNWLKKMLKMGSIQTPVESLPPSTSERSKEKTAPPMTFEEKVPPSLTFEEKVASPLALEEKEAPSEVPPKEEMQDTSSEWEQVGIHRQISQFFFNLILSFIVAVPGLTLSLYIYPNFIQPYPQVVGWQNLTGGFFGILATIFDLGIGAATVKFFAQYRVKDPQKAVRFLQLQAWWWILTAVAKTLIITTIGLFVFTQQASLAYLSWACILNAITIFPGMAGILGTALSGMQRYDYKVLCDVVGGTVINTFINYGVILLFRSLFANNILYGDSFGTLVGLTVGSIVTTWTSFLYYSIAFKKLGYSVSTLLRADFKMAEFKEAVRYGWKLALGGLFVPLVSTLEVYLVSQFVLNSSAEMGYYAMMANISNFVGTAVIIFQNLSAGISEAHGNGKMNLLSYYVTEGMHYVNLFTFVLFAVLIIIGGNILVGFTGPFWAPATKYLVILCCYQMVAIFSTSGDTILQGTGYTKYNAYAWAIEQSTRALLLILIIPSLHQYIGVVFVYLPATTAKIIFEYTIVRKKIVKFDWCFVHNFIAPGLAAVVCSGINYIFLLLIPPTNLLSTIILFLVAVFSSMFLYLFLLGFFGGWDDNTLKQFERGLNVVNFVGKLFRAFYKTSELGHRLSPIKNKYPVRSYDAAMIEARELTEAKRKLVI
ncbi:MAG TPA: polysaccharide biosynthesis C-terminal domain-containing protein [Candidatus Lokiarchaeia archaeon]|nr:polysaccharide biosynthesis C-terminal domain-containing protein [Candidatus Lokiarchaeia archaeon]